MDNNDPRTVSRVVPYFENEADEAQWWFDNKELIEGDFIAAMENGTYKHGRPLRYKVAPAPGQHIILDPADEKLASELAAKHGETYTDFVRRVVHQALELEKSA